MNNTGMAGDANTKPKGKQYICSTQSKQCRNAVQAVVS